MSAVMCAVGIEMIVGGVTAWAPRGPALFGACVVGALCVVTGCSLYGEVPAARRIAGGVAACGLSIAVAALFRFEPHGYTWPPIPLGLALLLVGIIMWVYEAPR